MPEPSAGEPVEPGAEPGWPAPPPSIGTDAALPPISIAQVADAAAAAEARKKRKQAIIIGCVIVDAIILAIVLAVVLS